MDITVTKWDPSEHLETQADIVAYLNAALEQDDPALLQAVLGDIAKARGMSSIAREAGVGRESLYKSLSPEGNPSWQTITKVLAALGVGLEATARSEV